MPISNTAPVDGLAPLLNSLSLHGVALYRGRMSAPWGLGLTRKTDSGSDFVGAMFHHVLSGSGCVLRLDTGETATLAPGDFALLPQGNTHCILSDANAPVTPLPMAQVRGTWTPDGWLCFGADGMQTETLCGDISFAPDISGAPDALKHPLLAILPNMIVLRGENGQPVPWLAATLDFLRCETMSGRPGYETVVSRLAEILFIQAVRSFLSEADANCPRTRYLHALTEGRIAPALQAIHAKPEHGWSVQTLAERCYLSRSAFALLFTQCVGIAPVAYLTQWRLFCAGRLLRGHERLTLGEIAMRVGYGSEAALSKVFKSHTGFAPGAYRGNTISETSSGDLRVE